MIAIKAADYLSFSGIEVANATRTDAYVRNGLAGRGFSPTDCDCDPIDDGPYVSPLADPAPWYTSERPESSAFLGLRISRLTVDPVAFRSVTPRFTAGASVGKLRARHRLISVEGAMLATTDRAMAYGERWLTDVLAGVIVGCAPDTVRIATDCTSVDDAFRTLRRVGIIDGPIFSPAGSNIAECVLQLVSFQLAAGLPYLLADETTCLAETILVGGS